MKKNSKTTLTESELKEVTGGSQNTKKCEYCGLTFWSQDECPCRKIKNCSKCGAAHPSGDMKSTMCPDCYAANPAPPPKEGVGRNPL